MSTALKSTFVFIGFKEQRCLIWVFEKIAHQNSSTIIWSVSWNGSIHSQNSNKIVTNRYIVLWPTYNAKVETWFQMFCMYPIKNHIFFKNFLPWLTFLRSWVSSSVAWACYYWRGSNPYKIRNASFILSAIGKSQSHLQFVLD